MGVHMDSTHICTCVCSWATMQVLQHFNSYDWCLACIEDYTSHKYEIHLFQNYMYPIWWKYRLLDYHIWHVWSKLNLHAQIYYDLAYKVLALWWPIHWAIMSSHIKRHTMLVIKDPHVITTCSKLRHTCKPSKLWRNLEPLVNMQLGSGMQRFIYHGPGVLSSGPIECLLSLSFPSPLFSLFSHSLLWPPS